MWLWQSGRSAAPNQRAHTEEMIIVNFSPRTGMIISVGRSHTIFIECPKDVLMK
jgi:hypothetical protein